MQQTWTDLTFKQKLTTNRSAESEVNMIHTDSGVEGSEVSIKNELWSLTTSYILTIYYYYIKKTAYKL